VRRDGLFIAEGTTVLNAMLTAPRFPPISMLVLENRLDGFLRMAAGRIPADTPVYVASRTVLDEIAGFPMHRGVLAIGCRPAQAGDPAALLASMPANAVVIGAAGIANHDNIGAIFRNAAAFAADAVLLDDTACDPLYRKAIRVSVGGVFRVPFARAGETRAMMELLENAGFSVFSLTPSGDGSLDALPATGRIALLLGAEGEGLPKMAMEASKTLRIPMVDDFDSLNVATAGAIALARLYEARKR
jgi:tRNA G18 (ribose-2'-O)-methylase SpoU